MLLFRFSLVSVLLACTAHAIQVKPSYGPPPQHMPHREYGVPQQIPFREYGPPALKYGPPKLNLVGSSGSSSGFYEEIKNHYGAPKPFYGPPHKIQQEYGPPHHRYGPPKPGNAYVSPPVKHQKPPSSYGPPPPQSLPLFQPAPQFNPAHQPASSYGPPPSGPLNIPPKQIFGPPPPNYGPPPLPNFNQKPESTIIITAGQNAPSQHQQNQQIQIQVDSSGHSHSVTGSQTPFHTACEGWKPIPAPIGSYVENNHIETQTGYSQVAQLQANPSQLSTQYSAAGSGTNSAITNIGSSSTVVVESSGTGGNSITDDLSDEQLVAVALQSSTFDADTSAQQYNYLPPTGPTGNFNKQSLNSIEAEALKLSLGTIDDSYSKPPVDSFDPRSKYSHKYKQQSGQQFGINGLGGRYALPLSGKFGTAAPPKGNFGLPPPPPTNYGLPQQSSGKYGPPPPPINNYGPPLQHPPTGNYGPPPSSGPGATTFAHHQTQAASGIQYGKQSGNLGPFPSHGSAQPSQPVAYRPPVPPGLFETIGATVQHLDKFGVKPQLQVPTYIPPAASEVPQSSSGSLDVEYGAPQQQLIPQHIIEQQLPQPRPHQYFVQQQNSHHQQQQQQQQILGNTNAEYGAPALPPLVQQRPPQAQYLAPPRPAQYQQQYLPPTASQQQQQFGAGASYSASATASYDNTAFASNQFNHETLHFQALPLQQQTPRFHNCGNGPNLVDGGNFNYQEQLQQQYSSGSGTSIAQSIPVAEQHTQFLSGPATSYGPPPSGGNELDHIGYASEKSQVSTFPDGTNAEDLPGLDGLNVLSAQKSQAIHFSSQETKNDNNYQINYGAGEQQPPANHEEILSADLLQTILNAVEQPQPQHQILPANHKAENRSDIEINSEPIEAEDENEPGVAVQETKNVEVQVYPDDETSLETEADVQEIKPIVVKEENEARH